MKQRDSLHRFLFEQRPVRGQIIHLDATWQAVLARRDYPPVIRQVLGEALAATALLAATIKFEGLLTLQLQARGPLHLLVVQCTDAGQLRALARWQGEVAAAPLAALCGEGHLAINLTTAHSREPYQGLVDLHGDSLAAALENYFARSEQLLTRLRLVADRHAAAGLMLQQLPEVIDSETHWQQLAAAGAALTDAELLTLAAPTLLQRAFPGDDLRLFEARPLAFRCTCSRERTAAMLRALGYTELQTLLAEQGTVSVNCEFCGACFAFDPIDIEELFVSNAPAAPSTRH